MQTRILFLFSMLIFGVFSVEIGGLCSDKAILEDREYNFLQNINGDKKLAFNKIASCASLRTGEDNSACCYIKVKFRNKVADKKFTHRGCTIIRMNEWNNMDDTIDYYEGNITNFYANSATPIDKVDVDIDCGSNYLKLAGLLLLALLL
jgi:hypothetical protein